MTVVRDPVRGLYIEILAIQEVSPAGLGALLPWEKYVTPVGCALVRGYTTRWRHVDSRILSVLAEVCKSEVGAVLSHLLYF